MPAAVSWRAKGGWLWLAAVALIALPTRAGAEHPGCTFSFGCPYEYGNVSCSVRDPGTGECRVGCDAGSRCVGNKLIPNSSAGTLIAGHAPGQPAYMGTPLRMKNVARGTKPQNFNRADFERRYPTSPPQQTGRSGSNLRCWLGGLHVYVHTRC